MATTSQVVLHLLAAVYPDFPDQLFDDGTLGPLFNEHF